MEWEQPNSMLWGRVGQSLPGFWSCCSNLLVRCSLPYLEPVPGGICILSDQLW